MYRLLQLIMAGCFAVSAAAPAFAEKSNPIFGNATVQVTTPSENKAVVAKGAYADLYGYYGNYYSAYASMYGAMGYYYKNSSYYSYAYSYASNAVTYYSYAAYYQTHGM